MTDADRMVAHGMGYESAVESPADTVAAPGQEEALADLAAENERLKGTILRGTCSCGNCEWCVISEYTAAFDTKYMYRDDDHSDGAPLKDGSYWGWASREWGEPLLDDMLFCIHCGSALLDDGAAIPHPQWQKMQAEAGGGS